MTYIAIADDKRVTVDIHLEGCKHLTFKREEPVGFSMTGQDPVDFAIMIRDILSGKTDDGFDNYPWKWHLAPCTRKDS
jgi:hypothetical protein